MTTTPPLRVLFFDVFGTCVAQRDPVADELSKAAKDALESDASPMNHEVRSSATKMVCLGQGESSRILLTVFAVIRAMVRLWRAS